MPAPAAAQEALDQDKFALVFGQLQCDTTVYENWQKKCSAVALARLT